MWQSNVIVIDKSAHSWAEYKWNLIKVILWNSTGNTMTNSATWFSICNFSHMRDCSSLVPSSDTNTGRTASDSKNLVY